MGAPPSKPALKGDAGVIRKIIKIDAAKCNSCGECVTACHEGAIGMDNGKAVLLRDDYCDGLGDCLPACPTGAITFEEREALAYDEVAVLSNLKSKTFKELPRDYLKHLKTPSLSAKKRNRLDRERKSCLGQWPVQIRLVSAHAAFFKDADLLVAADCCAYAYGDFHNEFMPGRVVLIGCPKLDAVCYTEKIAEILAQNDVRSVTVARMSVPCCGGIEQAVKNAISSSGKAVPCVVRVISPQGMLAPETPPHMNRDEHDVHAVCK